MLEFLDVEETDVVEHQGGVKEYFAFLGPADGWKVFVWKQFDGWVGFLPIVRAGEKLRGIGRTPSDEEVRQTAYEAMADYRTRRLLLDVGVRPSATKVR